MELIASESSALLVLSIQHVSTHPYLKPSRAARSQKLTIFLYPSISKMVVWVGVCGAESCCNEISCAPHRCDRMAYGGLSSSWNSVSSKVRVLRRRILEFFRLGS